MTTTLNPRPGLSAPIVNSIPTTWDAQWFRRFITDYLSQITSGVVTSVAAGTGIGVSAATGGITITNDGVTAVSGTANQIAVSPTTGAVVASLPHNVIIPAPASGTALAVGGAGGSNPTITAYGPTAAAQVDLTPDKGSYGATVLGFTSAPSATVNWARIGDVAVVYIPTIAGTSNNTKFQVSIPAAITPPTTVQYIAVGAGLSSDNSAPITDCIIQVPTNGYINFCHNNSPVGWTASGLKSSGGLTISYLLI